MDDPVPGAAKPPRPDIVGICYVVAIGDPGFTAADMRVRFEIRPNLLRDESKTVNVLGVDAACETIRAWLLEVCRRG